MREEVADDIFRRIILNDVWILRQLALRVALDSGLVHRIVVIQPMITQSSDVYMPYKSNVSISHHSRACFVAD